MVGRILPASDADGVDLIGGGSPFWRGECFVVARDGRTDEL